MASRGWNSAGLQRLRSKLGGYPVALERAGAEALVESAQVGAEVMRQVILNSGTGWKGRPGRVETGTMLSRVDHERTPRIALSSRGKVKLTARFGWLSHPEDYFVYQDLGFFNVGKGGYTVGMKATEQAYFAAREHMRLVIRPLVKKAWYQT